MSELSMGIRLTLRDTFSPGLGRAERAVQSFREGLRDANNNLNDLTRPGPLRRFTAELQEVSGGFKAVGTAVTMAGAGVAVGLGMAVKKAADFEAQLSSIKAVSGATADEMKVLKAQALAAGARTKYSALQAAQGQEELIKAGLTVEQVLKGGLDGALDLAAAGELDLKEAAEIASTALNAFKADQLSVAKAGDILAGAANASATNVHELRYGLSMASAVASGVGATFQDTATALAVLAQNGLKGSDAGTSLKTMFMNLVPTTDRQYKMFQKLGLLTEKGTSAFFDANGKLKDMASIAGLLRNSLAGLTEEQRLVALEAMFGSDAIRAGNIIYKEGADGIKKMWSEMSKVTAAEVARERMNNLNGELEELRGSFETAVISVGDEFIPTLRALTTQLRETTAWFNGLSAGQKKAVAWTAAIAAGFLLIAGPALLFIGFLPNIIAGFGALATGLGFVKVGLMAIPGLLKGIALGFRGLLLSNPIGWILLGITLLVTWLIHLYKTNETFRAKVNAAWNWLSNTWGMFITGVKAGIEGLGVSFNLFTDWVKSIADTGEKFVQSIIDGIKRKADGLYNTVKDVLAFARKLLPFSDAKEGPFSNLTGSGQSIVETMATGVKKAGPELHKSLSDVFNGSYGPSISGGAPSIPTGAAGASVGGITPVHLTVKMQNIFNAGGASGSPAEQKQQAEDFADMVVGALMRKLEDIAGPIASGLSLEVAL